MIQFTHLKCLIQRYLVYSNNYATIAVINFRISRPSSRWCHPAISSSVVPSSSCPQSLPASESFPMSQLFPRGGLSTGVSALASFLPKKSQGWSPSEWTGLISLQFKGLSRVFSNTTVQKHQLGKCKLKQQRVLIFHARSALSPRGALGINLSLLQVNEIK